MDINLGDDIQEREDKNIILFDKGFNDIQELSSKKRLDQNKKKKKPTTWYSLYLILFKNTLSSNHLIPKEELKLRLNILRKYLPPYYNAPKTTDNLNSSSLLKKFTYHAYSKNNFIKKLLEKSNKRSSIFLFEEAETKENKNLNDSSNQVFKRRTRKTMTQKFDSSRLNLFNFAGSRRGSIQKNKLLELKDINVIQEEPEQVNSKILQNFARNERVSPDKRKFGKRSTIKMEGQLMNKLIFRQKKKKQNSNFYFFEFERKAKLKLDKQNEFNELENINKDFLIRTPTDNEYSLILTDKRNMDISHTYFTEYLNKLNLETKNEKITTYKKELASQLLKFNELYYDSKLEDLGSDKTFNEIKSGCDLFINRFTLDKQEEKIISDLEKFL